MSKEKDVELNVLGNPLESCCHSPMTGYFRDGFAVQMVRTPVNI